MRHYPVMMNLENKPVLVIGGGGVAYRKIQGLLESGAFVTVVAVEIKPQIEKLAQSGKITWIAENFAPSHIHRQPSTILVFGATNNREVNVAIYETATALKIPCNIADVPDLCSFIVPALITQGDLMIAVSTSGSSPALARRIREELSDRYGPEYAEMTRFMGELRKIILRAGGASEENKELFLRVVDSELLTAIRSNDRDRIREILRDILPTEIDPSQVLQEHQSKGE